MTRGLSTPTQCGGCGEALPKTRYDDPLYSEVQIHPSAPALIVCAGKWGAKASCAERAIKAAKLCPGCGEKSPFGMKFVGQMCDSCRGIMRDGRKALEQAEPVQVRIDRFAFPSFYNTKVDDAHDLSKRQDELVHDLMRACAPDHFADWNPRCDDSIVVLPGPSDRTRSGGPLVRIQAKQLEPLRRFVTAVVDLFHEQRRVGREEGNNLLVRLARGELATDVFDAEAAKLRGKE